MNITKPKKTKHKERTIEKKKETQETLKKKRKE
jgi:hypothetical protein